MFKRELDLSLYNFLAKNFKTISFYPKLTASLRKPIPPCPPEHYDCPIFLTV